MRLRTDQDVGGRSRVDGRVPPRGTETIADAVDRDELAATVPVRLAASLAVVHLSSAVAYSLKRDEVDIDELSRTLLDQWLRGMQP